MIDQNSGPVATSLERPLGANLEPVLRENCDRLSSISWFRADWQRGGALTGFATFQDENDGPRDVVVKLPVPPREKLWLNRLQSAGDVAPRLYASGDELGGYDMAWVVMERFGRVTRSAMSTGGPR